MYSVTDTSTQVGFAPNSRSGLSNRKAFSGWIECNVGRISDVSHIRDDRKTNKSWSARLLPY